MGTALAALLARHGLGHGHGWWRGLVQRQLLLHRVGHAARQDVLDGIGHGRHLGVVPHGHQRAVVLAVGAQAHGAPVPGDLAHVAQGPLQKAAPRGQRQQAHAGGDPLLRLATLPHGHEELDGAVHGAVAHTRGHGQEGHDEVQRLVAFLRPVFELFGNGREAALRAALDHGAHRVHGRRGGRGRSHGGRRWCRFCVRFQHRAQDAVGPVSGQAFEPRAPGLQVQVLEVLVRVVGRDVHGLGDSRVHKGLHGFHHGDVVLRGHGQRRHKVVRQRVHIAAQLAVQAPGVVFHRVFGGAAVRLALLALVRPRKRRLNAVGGVVRKGQAHRARGGNRQQVAVADAVRADGRLQRLGQAAGEGAFGQIAGGVELGERASLARQVHRRSVGCIAHALGNARGHGAALGQVVAQAQHGQRVAHAGKAHANAAFGHGLVTLLRQRPVGDVQHVVECAHLQRHGLGEGVKVKRGHAAKTEGLAYEAGEDDGPQVTAAVRRQRLFAAVVHHQTIGIERVYIGHGHVVNVLHSRIDQRLHGSGKTFAIERTLVLRQPLLQAR